jgi:hypothetical protein
MRNHWGIHPCHRVTFPWTPLLPHVITPSMKKSWWRSFSLFGNRSTRASFRLGESTPVRQPPRDNLSCLDNHPPAFSLDPFDRHDFNPGGGVPVDPVPHIQSVPISQAERDALEGLLRSLGRDGSWYAVKGIIDRYDRLVRTDLMLEKEPFSLDR